MPEISRDLLIAVGLWFAIGFYLNSKLALLHAKLDKLHEQFDGLREYLYEIDPQFDDERDSARAFHEGRSMFAGAHDLELQREKKENGRRTLRSSFLESGFRSPRDD